MMTPTNKRVCPTCGQSVNEREIALFSGMVVALWRVFQWCEKNDQWQFSRKDIKHLFTSENQTARFGDWILFGGILYRPLKAKGMFGMNKERAVAFFGNKLQIPKSIWKDPLSKTLRPDGLVYMTQIPHLREFLDQNYQYMSKYRG